ncbi:MAG: YqcC family protein [Proteobacteria bacterium]|nr:YqcC family protein [Pseudomonadota bacterium]
MHDIPNRIADVLLEVEASLRIHGKWDDVKPTASALNSSYPFCLDTLSFEQWLQWIFLPKMKDTIEQTKPLPEQSAIFEYAEECLHKNDPSTDNLLKQLKMFDDLISIQASIQRH